MSMFVMNGLFVGSAGRQ